MKPVLLLGSGRLAPIFERLSHLLQNTPIRVVPSRNLTSNHLLEAVELWSPSFIVDLLDPSTDKLDEFEGIASRNIHFRRTCCSKLTNTPYFYISSANVYSKSENVIYEHSSLNRSSESPYLRLKLLSEAIVQETITTAKILRLTSIFYPYVSENRVSFFDDLIHAQNNNYILKPRDNDMHPISFIQAESAVSCIYRNLSPDCPPILNVTSDNWSSRFHLKNNLPYDETRLFGLRISTNYPHLMSTTPISP